MAIEPAVMSFGNTFLEYLIAIEIISGGTGPAKYVREGTNNQPLIFDVSALSEDELPAIWRSDSILAARALALVPLSKRDAVFEKEYVDARKGVLPQAEELYDRAREELSAISDPIARAARQSDIDSLKLHDGFARYNLGVHGSARPLFSEARDCVLDNLGRKRTTASLDAMAATLSQKLEAQGFQEGNLAERLAAMDKRFGLVSPDEVVRTYKEFMEQFITVAADMLDVRRDYFTLDARELPAGRGNVGSFEYEGNGKIVTSMSSAYPTTRPKLVFNTAHEATHLIQAVLAELYFKETGDGFAAGLTMSTASTALCEGIGELGQHIYGELVHQLLGDSAWAMETLSEQQRLERAAFHYTAEIAYEKLVDPRCDRDGLARELTVTHLQYGFEQKAATMRADSLVRPHTIHKVMAYWPFYTAAREIVERMGFLREATFHRPTFDKYVVTSKQRGPLTLGSMQMVLE